jgi:hypothetical protein
MILNVNAATGAARIAMPKLFDFTMYHGFMKSCTSLFNNVAIHKIEVEVSGVDRLDRFALDMLTLLKERAAAANKSILLLSSAIPVSRLPCAHLGEVFNASDAKTAQHPIQTSELSYVTPHRGSMRGAQQLSPVYGDVL